MNNDQFRKLALGAGASDAGSKNNAKPVAASPGRTPGILGSRQKASIPMTPRPGASMSRVTFARQMAEQFKDTQKKSTPRTSVPKGSRLAEGYVDRAKLRESGGDGSDGHKLKGLDFEALQRERRGETTTEQSTCGGKSKDDNGSDGEMSVLDVEAAETAETGEDVDEAFERLEKTDVQAVARAAPAVKRGQLAPASATMALGQKRTRDQILAELKAAREAAAQQQRDEQAAAASLGARFKKIGNLSRTAGSRIERDSRGREVLVIVDEDGHEKRKVRKGGLSAGSKAAAASTADSTAVATAAAAAEKPVLGMEVPEYYRKRQEEEAAAAAAAAAARGDNIFDDVGSDYDPLAGLEESGSDSSSDDESAAEAQSKADTQKKEKPKAARTGTDDREEGEVGASASSPSDDDDADRTRPRFSPTPPPPPPQQQQQRPRRSYFKDATLLSEEPSRSAPSMDDPAVLAALRKAKALREAAEAEEKSKETTEEAAREERLRKLLQSSDRDAEDLDLEFGTNRLEDGDDMDEESGGKRIRLSTWNGGGGGGDGDDDGPSHGGKAKRKRGPKKRKGDSNNAADVMRVLEKRKG